MWRDKAPPARIAIYAAILILFFTELTLFDRLRIYGVKPELLLVVTIFFGFHFGLVRGLEAGFISGILKDIFSVTCFGVNTFSFLFVGFLSGYFKDKLFKESFITQFLFSSFSVYLISAIYLGTLGWGEVSFRGHHYTYLPRDLFPYVYKGLYTGLLAPILFFALARIFGPKET